MPHRPSASLTRRSLIALAGTAAVSLRLKGAAAQTPVAVEEVDLVARISPMLAATPAQDLSPDVPLPFYYADLAGQLAAVGVERPDPSRQAAELQEGFFEGTVSLPLAARAFETGLADEWFPTFGFNPYAVGQTLFLSTASGVVAMFAGGYDRETVETALNASGYATVLQEIGGTYYSFGDDISPDTPVGRLGLGAMNQAMVTDDLLVFARDEGDLQEVTHTVGGYQPSMLEQDVWSGMVSLFSPDVVGMIPLSPGILEVGPAGTEAASPVAAVPAGGVQYLAFGVRAGARAEPMSLVGEGTPEATPAGAPGVPARIEARIRYGSEDLAEQEATAIPERWESASSALTGQPFRELMTLEAGRVSEQDPQVVELDFASETPNRWVQMIHQRDLLPLAPAMG